VRRTCWSLRRQAGGHVSAMPSVPLTVALKLAQAERSVSSAAVSLAVSRQAASSKSAAAGRDSFEPSSAARQVHGTECC
jgi:hypothetical protein